MLLCRHLCLEVKKATMPIFHVLSAVKWGATRTRARPLCIVSALFLQNLFSSRLSLFAMPRQHPNIGKTNRFGGFGFLSEFFDIPFRFSFFLGISNFRISVFLVGAFPRKASPSTGFIVLPSSPPKPKATHPKQPPNAVENATMQVVNANMQVNCCCWFPSKLSINADTNVLCVSMAAKGRGGQKTEALRATQHAGQAWRAIKGV